MKSVELPMEQIITIVAGCLSTITAFILGLRKQKSSAQHQFNIDNEKFRKEVLSLVEVEKNNNQSLLKRVETLEVMIFDLKKLNQEQALQKIKDTEEISRLTLTIEKQTYEISRIRTEAGVEITKNKQLVEMLEKKLQIAINRCDTLEHLLQESLIKSQKLNVQLTSLVDKPNQQTEDQLKEALQRCAELEVSLLKFKEP